MIYVTLQEIRNATGATPANALKYVEPINEACHVFHINTVLRASHFLAQAAHESLHLSRVVENLNYSAPRLREVFPKYFPTEALAKQFAKNPEAIANRVYGGRMGNNNSGDGWRFRGRGLGQLTGRANYEIMSDWLAPFGCPNLIEFPDALLQPRWAVMSFGAYWAHNSLNQHADRDDLVTLTKRLNGGTNGLTDRRNLLIQAKRSIKTVCVGTWK